MAIAAGATALKTTPPPSQPAAPTECLIALGSNQGDRERLLRTAIERLRALPGTEVIRVAAFRETEPVGGPPQPRYLNGAVLLRTALMARPLLDALRAIEREAGRERRERWGPRTLDLDLVLFGDAIIDTPDLTVPHPRAHERRFVLEPAAEIAPAMRHPVLKCTLAEALARLDR